MILNIDKISEMSGSEAETSKEYLNIRPKESMSDQETTDFITKEFEKAHDEAEAGAIDTLISDVFNRSEDEMNIDFELTDDVVSVLEIFKSDDWETMSTEERMSAVGKLVNVIGKELQLEKIPEVELYEDNDAYGFYDQQYNHIELNSKFFDDPVELVNTVAHELRHAYQNMRADMLETREDALYKINFVNYISPVSLPGGGYLFFTDYYNQYVEVEARAFANKFTEAMI
jgi:hypothetical protein